MKTIEIRVHKGAFIIFEIRGEELKIIIECLSILGYLEKPFFLTARFVEPPDDDYKRK